MGRRYGENAFSTLELENALEKIYSQDSTDFSFKSVETVLKDDIAKSGKNKNVILSLEAFTSNVVDRGLIATRLKSIFPDAKILIIVREQVDSLLSMYSYLVAEKGRSVNLSYGRPSVRDFDTWIEEQEIYPYRSYIGTLKYSNIIQYYQDIFGESNVTVLMYEELLNTPEVFAKKISNYLEIEYDSKFLELVLKRTNISPRGLRLYFYKIKNTAVYNFFGLKYVPIGRIARLFKFSKITTKKKRNIDISKESLQKIKNIYRKDNLKLESILKINLSKYGYSK